MTVKSSISLNDAQAEYAHALVRSGQFPSLSAVMQQGLELLRARAEDSALERAALRQLLGARESGEFVSSEDMGQRLDAMLDARIAGLDDL